MVEKNLLQLCYMPGFCEEVRTSSEMRIFAPPLKSRAPPLGKVSMKDQSENLTFFGRLGSTLRKKVFL
jgi:hypothetical protein